MFIQQLFAATPVPFGPKGSPSSIVKSPVSQLSVLIDKTIEDEQGNKRLHGGVEKVLHQYSIDSYAVFAQHFPDHANDFVPGSIGENIAVAGMTDKNTRIGDIYRMGEVLLQVSSPREPCCKISQRFGIKGLDSFVNQHGITGWYFRVLEPGIIKQGDKVTLEMTDSGSLSIYQFMAVLNNKSATKECLESAAAISDLDPEWAKRLLRKGKTASS
jgi:MOSC domain-containing protein YiiM